MTTIVWKGSVRHSRQLQRRRRLVEPGLGGLIEVWAYLGEHDVPVHGLYAQGYTSIGCAPCTRAIGAGEDDRAGRWWWETNAPKECGMHCSIEHGGFEHELHAILGDEANKH